MEATDETLLNMSALDSTAVDQKDENTFEVFIKKAAMFSNYPSLKKKLRTIPKGKEIIVNFKDCVLINDTVMERLHQFKLDYEGLSGHLDFSGLEKLIPNSLHPLAARRALKSVS